MKKQTFVFKKDKYSLKRGNYSRLLELRCRVCNDIILIYQKDGKGALLRIYLDRIVSLKLPKRKMLICQKCKEVIGVLMKYKKENRNSYRLFQGSLKKRIISSKNVR